MTKSLQSTRVQMGRRYRQLRDIWHNEGPTGLRERACRAAAERLTPKNPVLPVRPADVNAADIANPFLPSTPAIVPGEPVILNWVMTPPSAGSGGHTTLFRFINYLEAHGYRNRVYFYDVYAGDHLYFKSIVRDYYQFFGAVASVDHGMDDAHAVIATSWTSAYPVFNARCSGKRMYFVQDYEPYFHPVGTSALLAENTYRMGFHAITAGRWLSAKLSNQFGMTADPFDFGCDLSTYRIDTDSKRSGLVFYARPEAPRRATELGLMTMELFAARRPDVDLHFYGDTMGKLPFRFIDHGRIKTAELNRIYNQCYAGLSLSLTNVSLVPHEMLAAGCIPVVNDAEQNRLVLNNPFVRYVAPYPAAMAAELERLVATPDFASLAQSAAGSVRGVSWNDAGAVVDTILRNALRAPVGVGPRAAAKSAAGSFEDHPVEISVPVC